MMFMYLSRQAYGCICEIAHVMTLHACAILQKRGAELAAAKLLERKAAKAEGEEVLDAKPLSSTVAEVDGKPVLQSKS